MLSKVFCAACAGLEAYTITIETEVSDGVNFFLVGLPDGAVRESQQRICSSLKACGYRIPGRRIVVNMAPADVRKEGSAFDVPIALGILCASGQISQEQVRQERLDSFMIMGELALDGSLRPMRGALPIALHARKEGFSACIFPKESALEAVEVEGIDILYASNLREVINLLLNPDDTLNYLASALPRDIEPQADYYEVDFADIRGQQRAKRALEIAAAGSHNMIMTGAPGCGKTLLARAFPSILPPMTIDERLETGGICSIMGMIGDNGRLPWRRPFRAPHHTATIVSLVGGGAKGLPGEISLAHNGVLFLDELPEFKREVLELLRQPLEDGEVHISRARVKYRYPASFILLAAMNPCPCGYYGSSVGECKCTSGEIQRYRRRISGPLLDRIDLRLELKAVGIEELSNAAKGESSSSIRERVTRAREIQQRRFGTVKGIHCNAQMGPHLLWEMVRPDGKAMQVLNAAMERMKLSMRSYSRILKVARTIADLEAAELVEVKHIAEAISLKFDNFA